MFHFLTLRMHLFGKIPDKKYQITEFLTRSPVCVVDLCVDRSQVSTGPGLAALHAAAVHRLLRCSIVSALPENWPIGLAGVSGWNTETAVFCDFRPD